MLHSIFFDLLQLISQKTIARRIGQKLLQLIQPLRYRLGFHCLLPSCLESTKEKAPVRYNLTRAFRYSASMTRAVEARTAIQNKKCYFFSTSASLPSCSQGGSSSALVPSWALRGNFGTDPTACSMTSSLFLLSFIIF